MAKEDEMETLVGYLTFTKGIEYLIAIGFLLAFIVFWLLVYGKGKGRIVPIVVLAYMVLGIGILLGSCLTMPAR
jgi:archaellum biogenesis protein FlaJ (TadC family)